MEKVVREMLGPDLMRSYMGGCSDDFGFSLRELAALRGSELRRGKLQGPT